MNFIIYNNQAVSVTYNGQVIAANSSYTAVDSAILGFANDPSLAVDVQAGNTGVSLTSASSAQITNAAGISLINNLILALSSVSSPLPANAAQESGGHLASLDSKFAVDGSGNLKAVVENFPSTQPVSLASLPLPANAAQESGGHLASLDSKLSIDGSGNLKAVVENFPSIQSIKPASNRLSGSLNGLGQTFVIATSGYGTATFQLTGTYVATLVVEASLDGTNYFSVVSYNYDGAPATPGLVVVSCASFEFVQLRVFAYTSGTVNIVAQADVGSNIMQVFQPESSYNFFVQASQADDSKPWLVQSVSNNVSINLNALGQTFVVSTAGYGSVVFAIGGTWVGQLVAEASIDGIAWYYVYPFNSGSYPIGNDFLRLPCSGFKFARLRVVSYTSGTINLSAQADAPGPGGVVNSPTDGQKSTFSVNANINVPNNATDIFTISAGAGKTVKVLSIRISGTQSTAGNVQANLILRSGQNSGGTPHALTVISHNLSSSTAVVNWYSTNPTSLGAAANPIRADKLFVPAAGTAAPADKLVYDFGNRPGQAITLRGSQLLALNLNSATLNGGNFNCSVEYTEE